VPLCQDVEEGLQLARRRGAVVERKRYGLDRPELPRPRCATAGAAVHGVGCIEGQPVWLESQRLVVRPVQLAVGLRLDLELALRLQVADGTIETDAHFGPQRCIRDSG